MTLFAFDLDDTLLDKDKRIGPDTLAVLNDRMLRGDQVVIVTSRPVRSVRSFVDPRLLAGVHLITLNGAVTRAVDGWVCRAPGLGQRLLPIQLAMDQRDHIHYSLETDGELFAINRPLSDAVLLQMHNATPGLLLDRWSIDLDRVCKMAVDGQGRVLDEFHCLIEAQGLQPIAALGGTFINIVSPEVDKGSSLVALAAYLGMTMKDVVAFGDDLPDLGMLRCAGTAVAMGNAEVSVQQAADHVISDCDSDCIGEFIRNYCR